MTSIGDSVFESCSALTSITIPSGVTSIEDRAFVVCRALTSITIPSSVTSIYGGAFVGCSVLIIKVEFGDSNWNVGYENYKKTPQDLGGAEYSQYSWYADWNKDGCPIIWGYTEE